MNATLDVTNPKPFAYAERFISSEDMYYVWIGTELQGIVHGEFVATTFCDAYNLGLAPTTDPGGRFNFDEGK